MAGSRPRRETSLVVDRRTALDRVGSLAVLDLDLRNEDEAHVNHKNRVDDT